MSTKFFDTRVLQNPNSLVSPKRGAGAAVGVGMLRGRGISFLEKDACLFGFLVSRLLGFEVSWFQSVLVSWFQSFLVSWFQNFQKQKVVSCITKIRLAIRPEFFDYLRLLLDKRFIQI